MEVKAKRRVAIFDRVGGKPVMNKVCIYWLAGRCNRNPCRFMHRELPPPQSGKSHSLPLDVNFQKQSNKMNWINPNYCIPENGDAGRVGGSRSGEKVLMIDRRKRGHMDQEIVDAPIRKDRNTESQRNVLAAETTRMDTESVLETWPKQCKYWITGNCIHGDKCKDLHSWFYGSRFTMLTKLEGHTQPISGICLPSGHDKLYSGGKDGCIRAWNRNSDQCAGLESIDGEVGCLISQGSWLFVGLHNAVKAWNLKSHAGFTLSGTGGLVCSMDTDDDKLFAGTEDGSILIWKWNSGCDILEPAALLKEHSGAVCSLVVGAKRLYSGSRDCTIKEWDVQTLECLQTLHGHARDVTAVLCWECYLISASLDSTLMVWGASERGGPLQVVHEIKDDFGVNALRGMHDAEDKPIVLSSYADNTVRLYELPSFTERGRIFSKSGVQVIETGTDGFFFTGESTGEIFVWKLLECS